ncbi:carbohydrate ABC transporter permease [uncultured Sphaerochaeta sp.]|uniref:carbohydrate ABC transporter permease n=1 Tax=uncultured Sphaerochaeta sp. TaxID=886478 RepID=UPI002A0A8F26|nr:carbohydrate ABC transporter permease [uncultured Sphaerochaeta sp.]
MAYLKRKQVDKILNYIILIAIGIVMVYPFLWLIGSSFKTSYEIFADLSVIPKNPTLNGYKNGWRAAGASTFLTFFKNTYVYVVLKVLATALSAVVVGYGFSRFDFPYKKSMFSVLIATLLFPMTVVLVPSYIMFSKIGWVDSYTPLILPSLFAADTYFVFLMVQFFRSLPRDMDEAAIIDGCGPVRRLIYILVPLLKPAIVTVMLFQFIWTGNDFLGPMIYLSSEHLFPVSIGLKISMDTSSGMISWENTMAMSVLAILPPLILYMFAQRNFVEGISTTGLKG